MEDSSCATGVIGPENIYKRIKIRSQVEVGSTCLSVQFHPKGKVYGVASADGHVRIYRTNVKVGYPLVTKLNGKEEKHHGCCATSIRFRPWGQGDVNPNNILIASFTNGKLKTFHYPSAECVHELKEGREIITAEYSYIGDTFATTGGDGALIVYDDETREKLVEYKPPFWSNDRFRRMYSIAYHPVNTDEIITGGWDGVVRYFDLRLPMMIKEFHGPQIYGEGLAINPNGSEICTASWRRNVPLQLWDYGSGKLIQNIDFKTELTLNNSTISSSQVWSGGYGASFSSSDEFLHHRGFLPPLMTTATAYHSSRKPSRVPAIIENAVSTLPKMLYSCKYFEGGDYIVVSGSLNNGAVVINKYTSQIVGAVSELEHHVYSVDTNNTSFLSTSGSTVALFDCLED